MPEMDGYTLTTEVRSDLRLKDLVILLHSSLSGGFNKKMTDKVGADKFMPKFRAGKLVESFKSLLIEKGKM